jgi:hypothetical protein
MSEDKTLIEEDRGEFPFPRVDPVDGRYQVLAWWGGKSREDHNHWAWNAYSDDLPRAQEYFQARLRNCVSGKNTHACLVDAVTQQWVEPPTTPEELNVGR